MANILNVQAEAAVPAGSSRPNIIWLCLEDCSPSLGCYGDQQATTPNIDRLAAGGAMFTRAFSHAPICSASRGGIIQGMYTTTFGAHHHRSHLLHPPEVFTHYLRQAGYYVSWGGGPDFCGTLRENGKRDFNYNVLAGSFDETVDWVAKAPRQPFFAFANLFNTHEGQVSEDDLTRTNTLMLTPQQRHDPAKMVLPPYLPDVPAVRRHIANYYDAMTANDYWVGQVMAALDRQGLMDNTLVCVFSDHGWGFPRGKRWLYDTGIHTPLIMRWPGHIKPGTVRKDLAAWVDLAPTALHAAGVEVPARMQGQSLLAQPPAPRQYVFAARDRIDVTLLDHVRCVRDERFKYIRNFNPERPYSQPDPYGDVRPSRAVLQQLHEAGKLNALQERWFVSTKPREELYDTLADPWEIHNLAAQPEHQAQLREMSAALDRWMIQTKDMGEIPEAELNARGVLKPGP